MAREDQQNSGDQNAPGPAGKAVDELEGAPRRSLRPINRAARAVGFDPGEAVRFVITGALAIGLYLVLFELFRRSGILPLWAATATAYVLATVLNYWLNYHWSFAAQAEHAGAVLRYAIVACASVSLNTVTVPFLVNLGLPPALAGFAFAISWPVISFFAQKLWVFRER